MRGLMTRADWRRGSIGSPLDAARSGQPTVTGSGAGRATQAWR